MFTPEQVIPFLSDDDEHVRDQALRYFENTAAPSPLTADHLWQAIDRFGVGIKSGRLISQLDDVPQTESSYQRLMQAVRARHERRYHRSFESVVRRLDWPLLCEHRDELLACGEISQEVRKHLELRISLADQSNNALWNRLMEHGREEAHTNGSDFDPSESDALIDALSRNHEGIPPLAVEVLEDPRSNDDWRAIFAASFLAKVRYEPAIDTLLRVLEIDTDVLPDRAVDALVNIGTDEVIQKIEVFYPDKEWHTRLFASHPLPRLKRPQSLELLLRLIKIEKAEDLRVFMLNDVRDMGSLEAVDATLELCERYPSDAEVDDLLEATYVVARMQGVELPDLAKLQPRIRAYQRRYERAMRDLPGMLDDLDRQKDKPSISRDVQQQYSDDPLDLQPVATIRRDSPKVGRNDPCPCGSGKKYKKCCGG